MPKKLSGWILTGVAALTTAAVVAQTPPPSKPPVAQTPAAGKPPVVQTPAAKPTPTTAPTSANAATAGQTAAADLAMQVELDRAGFSPGEIDGRGGSNTKKALAAYMEVHKTAPVAGTPTTTYVITDADAAGPFVKVPVDMMAKAKLKTLGYSSLTEALAERFHCSPALLTSLNRGVKMAAGATITVPNVIVAAPKSAAAPAGKAADAPAKGGPTAKPTATAAPTGGTAAPTGATGAKPADAAAGSKIVVSKGQSSLRVLDGSGATIFYAPVTSGSEHDPLPLGVWSVNAVTRNPVFRYNPDLFWDADEKHTKATIPAGPNGPVGVVWIDLSKEHYGIHGSPEPGKIGYTQSHGCVRLTNWDAARLADLVKKGTPVHFVE
ncbi:MAG TPA: L,D-transpeptidase [Vicinamibacterales bacterium]|nr:L,D-transpeptidase [Vicinamibacterales bacterium]